MSDRMFMYDLIVNEVNTSDTFHVLNVIPKVTYIGSKGIHINGQFHISFTIHNKQYSVTYDVCCADLTYGDTIWLQGSTYDNVKILCNNMSDHQLQVVGRLFDYRSYGEDYYLDNPSVLLGIYSYSLPPQTLRPSDHPNYIMPLFTHNTTTSTGDHIVSSVSNDINNNLTIQTCTVNHGVTNECNLKVKVVDLYTNEIIYETQTNYFDTGGYVEHVYQLDDNYNTSKILVELQVDYKWNDSNIGIFGDGSEIYTIVCDYYSKLNPTTIQSITKITDDNNILDIQLKNETQCDCVSNIELKCYAYNTKKQQLIPESKVVYNIDINDFEDGVCDIIYDKIPDKLNCDTFKLCIVVVTHYNTATSDITRQMSSQYEVVNIDYYNKFKGVTVKVRSMVDGMYVYKTGILYVNTGHQYILASDVKIK